MRRRFAVLVAIAAAPVAMGLVLGTTSAAQAPASKVRSELVAHEWGTFTSVAAEDGKAVVWATLAGQRDLPCFVAGLQEIKILPSTVRMETPVVYFYTPTPTTVDVAVEFRQGIINEWYPSATVATSINATGSIAWPSVRVTPGAAEHFPGGAPADSHYYAARATDATPLEVNGQQEKFLFYRGIGTFQPPITATMDRSGSVTVKAATSAPLGDVIVFQNRGGEMSYQVASFSSRTAVFKPFAHDGEAIAPLAELEHILKVQGLYEKEAKAMVATWRDSWFEEGTRVFYIAPKRFVDEVLPITIKPAPAAIARVFVGRMEIITADRIAEVAKALAAGDTASLLRNGRFLSSISERLIATKPEAVKQTLRDAMKPVFAASAAAASAGGRCQ